MNKVQLIGHVGEKPEIRTMQSGGKVASFPLATSQRWKDKKTGEKKERTEWHRVVIFNSGLVTVVEKFVQKGGQLLSRARLKRANGRMPRRKTATPRRLSCVLSTATSICWARNRMFPPTPKATCRRMTTRRTTSRRMTFRTDIGSEQNKKSPARWPGFFFLRLTQQKRSNFKVRQNPYNT